MEKVGEKQTNLTSIEKMFEEGIKNMFQREQLRKLCSFFSNSGAILNVRDRFEIISA